MKNSKYLGISFLFSIGKYRKFSIDIDEYTVKFNFLFFTFLFASKDLNNMLESYMSTLLDRLKELEVKLEKNKCLGENGKQNKYDFEEK